MHQKRLDAFRGISALAVLVGHVLQIWQAPAIVVDIAAIGARHAVLVFFLLSGRLITQSIQSNIARGGFNWRPYAVARVTRIYPPFFGAIAVTILLCGLVRAFDLPAGRLTVSARDFIYAAFAQSGFLDANGPLWTLYMEIHLYALAMLIVLRSWWLAVAVALLAYWTHSTPEFAFYALVWGLGAASARYRIPLVLPAVALMVGLILRPESLRIEQNWQSYCVQGLACFIWCRWMLAPGRAPLAWTADFSYSLYAIHFPLLLFAYAVSPSWITAIAMLPFTLCVAMLFARLFENQRLFRPLVHWLFRSPAGVAASAGLDVKRRGGPAIGTQEE